MNGSQWRIMLICPKLLPQTVGNSFGQIRANINKKAVDIITPRIMNGSQWRIMLIMQKLLQEPCSCLDECFFGLIQGRHVGGRPWGAHLSLVLLPDPPGGVQVLRRYIPWT